MSNRKKKIRIPDKQQMIIAAARHSSPSQPNVTQYRKNPLKPQMVFECGRNPSRECLHGAGGDGTRVALTATAPEVRRTWPGRSPTSSRPTHIQAINSPFLRQKSISGSKLKRRYSIRKLFTQWNRKIPVIWLLLIYANSIRGKEYIRLSWHQHHSKRDVQSGSQL